MLCPQNSPTFVSCNTVRPTERAEHYGFEIQSSFIEPFYTARDAEIVQVACQLTAVESPHTVPYGTDAFFLDNRLQLVVLGPGDIAQAHTVGKWIAIDQLQRAVTVYERMIETLCIHQ